MLDPSEQDQGQYQGRQFGNYRLVKLLGEGGFAEVYLGEHVYLGTQAAVKVLISQLTDEGRALFRDEARMVMSLEHPNIVRVYDFGIESHIPFIVMSYAPNGTLRKLYPRGSRLPLQLIVSYVKQIAFALQSAHDQKLIHRDIKPDNLLVGRNGEILLSDFGLALVAHSTHSMSTHEESGTISYMAPEQMQGRTRIASDQYALGVVVYEWLSGTPPFTGTALEIGMQHLLASPPSLREKVPAIPKEVEQVVLTALAKDPHHRFGSVQAFAIALEQASLKPSPSMLLCTYRGHSHWVFAVAWSPDGTSLASASGDGTVQIWNATNAETISTSHCYSFWGYAVAWSPDGTRIASAGDDKTVKVWDATAGEKLYTYHGHADVLLAVSWSPDGSRIASAGKSGTVQVWEATTGKQISTYGSHAGAVNTLAWSPAGSRIVSGSDDQTVQVWEATTGDHLWTYGGHAGGVNTVAWSLDGVHMASGSKDETVHVWEATTGKHIYTYGGHAGAVNAVAWSPDGRHIASGGDDKVVRVWKATTGEHVCTYRGHTDWVNTLAWSPDGKCIASGGYDHTIQVWRST
jgi:eukaryotic-like serine/threonine-protein kinase